jgi:vacuolar-type H+-ATPase subunit E/Vma4
LGRFWLTSWYATLQAKVLDITSNSNFPLQINRMLRHCIRKATSNSLTLVSNNLMGSLLALVIREAKLLSKLKPSCNARLAIMAKCLMVTISLACLPINKALARKC